MTLVPLAVFILFVVVALGGPTSFINIVSGWVFDIATYVGRLIKDL